MGSLKSFKGHSECLFMFSQYPYSRASSPVVVSGEQIKS